jgi:hypothetical protein
MLCYVILCYVIIINVYIAIIITTYVCIIIYTHVYIIINKTLQLINLNFKPHSMLINSIEDLPQTMMTRLKSCFNGVHLK